MSLLVSTRNDQDLIIKLPTQKRAFANVLKTLLLGNVIFMPLVMLFTFITVSPENTNPLANPTLILMTCMLNITLMALTLNAVKFIFKSQTLKIGPYQVIQGKWHLPTNLLLNVSFQATDGKRSMLFGGIPHSMLTLNPITHADEVKDCLCFTWGDPQNPSFEVMDLLMTAAENKELVSLVKNYMASHTEVIQLASQKRLDQMGPEIEPPPGNLTHVIRHHSMVTIQLPYQVLDLHSDTLVIAQGKNKETLSWNDIQGFGIETEWLKQPKGPKLRVEKLYAYRHDAQKSLIWKASPPKLFSPLMLYEMAWVKEMLERHLLYFGSTKNGA